MKLEMHWGSYIKTENHVIYTIYILSYWCNRVSFNHRFVLQFRPHTTMKNARNIKSIFRAKLPYFEGFFKLWVHDQQKLPFLQMLISFANQNLVVLCVKRPRNGCSTNYLSFRFFKPLLATFALFLPLFPPNPTISTFAFNKMYKWSLPI